MQPVTPGLKTRPYTVPRLELAELEANASVERLHVTIADRSYNL